MIPISKRQRAPFNIYKKQKITKHIYIYKQKSRQFVESKIICVTFIRDWKSQFGS